MVLFIGVKSYCCSTELLYFFNYRQWAVAVNIDKRVE